MELKLTVENLDSDNLFHFRKRMLILIIYLMIGFIILFWMVLIINSHVLHLKVETAVVSMPIEIINSPVNGSIKNIFVTENQIANKGMPLFEIDNIDIEKDLLLARLQLNEANSTLSYLNNLLETEKVKLNIYKNIGKKRVLSAQAMLNTSKESLASIANKIERLKKLHEKHYISDLEWDEAIEKLNNAKYKMQSAQADKDVEDHSLNAINDGMFFTGNKIEGAINDIKAQIESEKNKIQINSEKVKIYESILDKLMIKSPFKAKVVQIMKNQGAMTDNSKPVVLLQKIDEKKQIIAFLTQSEISHVGFDSNVKIYISPLGKIIKGKVSNIDRTNSFIDSVKSQYQWHDTQLDRTAIVTIDINEQSLLSQKIELNAGMPAIVYFPRKFNLF